MVYGTIATRCLTISPQPSALSHPEALSHQPSAMTDGRLSQVASSPLSKS